MQDISVFIPPRNWTKNNQKKCLDAWRSHTNHGLKEVEIIEASQREKDALVQLISRTLKSHLAGQGCDAQKSGYSQMKVVKSKE